MYFDRRVSIFNIQNTFEKMSNETGATELYRYHTNRTQVYQINNTKIVYKGMGMALYKITEFYTKCFSVCLYKPQNFKPPPYSKAPSNKTYRYIDDLSLYKTSDLLTRTRGFQSMNSSLDIVSSQRYQTA
jgi:hypothetical protein